MRARGLLLASLASLALAGPVAAEGIAWLPGDHWTWSRPGAVTGSLDATVQSGALTTSEVERTTPGPGVNASEVRVTRAWAAPFQLLSETRVEVRCVALPVGQACGNHTERWSYSPALDLVRAPLTPGAGWTQSVRVAHEVQDELAPAGGSSDARDEVRHVRVRGAVNVSTGAGTLAGVDVAMDDEASDTDGAWEAWVYAPSAAQLASRSKATAGQEQVVWLLERASLVQRPAPPPPSPPPSPAPAPAPNPPPEDPPPSAAGPSGGPGGPSHGPTSPAPTESPGAPSAPATSAPSTPSAVGPPKGERPLRTSDALPLLALAVAGLAALALWRR